MLPCKPGAESKEIGFQRSHILSAEKRLIKAAICYILGTGVKSAQVKLPLLIKALEPECKRFVFVDIDIDGIRESGLLYVIHSAGAIVHQRNANSRPSFPRS